MQGQTAQPPRVYWRRIQRDPQPFEDRPPDSPIFIPPAPDPGDQFVAATPFQLEREAESVESQVQETPIA